MLRKWRRFFFRTGWIATLSLLLSPRAKASVPPVPLEAARDAYDRGAAFAAKQAWAEAAAEFSRADALVPTPEALTAALDAAVLADAVTLGLQLLERARERTREAEVDAPFRRAWTHFSRGAGEVVVSCKAPCQVAIDGESPGAPRPRWLTRGPHRVSARMGGAEQVKTVYVAPGNMHEVIFAPDTQPQKAPSVGTETGISPLWFVALAASTAGSGAATAISFVQANRDHDAFVERGCADGGGPGCQAAAEAGGQGDVRTLALASTTAVLGIATALVGLFAVRWGGLPKPGPGQALAWRFP